MYKKIFNEFDNIKAPKNVVDRAIINAKEKIVEDGIKTNSNICIYKPKKKLATGLLAACFTLIFMFSAFLGLGIDRHNTGKQSKGFIITANAYEVEKLGEKSDSAVIGAYTGELSGGWAMYYNLERYKDLSPNFFQSYVFGNFTIEGEGIESVSFRSKAEGTYFALSPAGIYSDITQESFLESYSQLSLSNSQYSEKELKEHSDGLSFGEIYADTFTFANYNGTEKIDFSKKLEFVIESNHGDPEISEMLDRLWECEQQLSACKSEIKNEYGESTAEEERLYNEIDTLSEKIRKLVLEDATIDITVKFKDGSTLTKSLKVGLERVDGTLWLTVSENS